MGVEVTGDSNQFVQPPTYPTPGPPVLSTDSIDYTFDSPPVVPTTNHKKQTKVGIALFVVGILLLVSQFFTLQNFTPFKKLTLCHAR